MFDLSYDTAETEKLLQTQVRKQALKSASLMSTAQTAHGKKNENTFLCLFYSAKSSIYFYFIYLLSI